MTITTKTRIISELKCQSNLTSYEIYERIQEQGNDISSDTIDRNLKELTDAGALTRQKLANDSGRMVYHYNLATSRLIPVDNDAEIEPDEDEADEVEIETVPCKVYLVRKNDIDRNIWSNRQYVFARLLQPFVKRGRTFAAFGNTVISIFTTDTPLSRIEAKLQADMPDVTFKLETTLEGALNACASYGSINNYVQSSIITWSNSYFANWGMEAETVDADRIGGEVPAPPQPTEAPAPETITVQKADWNALVALVQKYQRPQNNA